MGCPLARVLFHDLNREYTQYTGHFHQKNVTLAMNCLGNQWDYGWSANFLNGRTIVHTMRKM